jgi:hypothetical protein
MFRNAIVIASCCLVAASFNSVAQEKTSAQILAEALKAGNKDPAAINKLCKLFSMSEAGSYIGATVRTVDNAAAGTGCQWLAGGDNGSMLVQVVPARYHEQPKGGEGFKKLPEIGPQAFVTQSLGGWHAGSLQGAHAVHVLLSGKSASEAKTIELLKESMKRETAAGEK